MRQVVPPVREAGVMERFEAVEEEFPEGVPKHCIAVLSVRVLEDGWMVNLNVRPGTDATVKKLAKKWAAREVMRLASDPSAGPEWEEHVLPEGILMMQKYGGVEHLPEP